MNILEEIQVYAIPEIYPWIIFACVIIAIIGAFLYDIKQKYFSISIVLAIVLALASITCACCGVGKYPAYIKYKVEITDETSFNEIYNNYEILKHYDYSNVYEIKEIKK